MTGEPGDVLASASSSGAAALRAADPTAAFAADVQYYLAQDPRQLPSRYLYDDLGSALFDAICRLPWYRVTRAESRLVQTHGAEILRRAAPLSALIELGSGSGEKLLMLLEQRTPEARPLQVCLVDISPAALTAAARLVSPLPQIEVRTYEAPYEAGLRAATSERGAAAGVLALLLGSNIGNYDPPGAAAFVRSIRSQLRLGDRLLVGADLVKPPDELVLAYDDPLGVTAAFNRNLLVRINRELGANFDLSQFTHRAVWNAAESRVEMHLVATARQAISIPDARLDFEMQAAEIIWTESSYKYRPEAVVTLLEDAGFRLEGQWLDRQDHFALTLVRAS